MVDKIKTKKSIRELFLWYCVNFGLFIVFTTEFLSFFGLINNFSIFTCWFILLLLGYIISISKFRYYFCNLITKINFSINVITLFRLFIIAILILTLLTALIYPPNTPDSLSYHMSKVMHWIQNGNVEFYSTSITRQLYLSPFSEFVILHLQLLTNGSRSLRWWKKHADFIDKIIVSVHVAQCDIKELDKWTADLKQLSAHRSGTSNNDEAVEAAPSCRASGS